MGSQISRKPLRGVIRLLPQASFKSCPSKHHLGCITASDATVLVKRSNAWQSPASNIAVKVFSCSSLASRSYAWPKKPEAPNICFTSSSCLDISRAVVSTSTCSSTGDTPTVLTVQGATHTRWTWWRIIDDDTDVREAVRERDASF